MASFSDAKWEMGFYDVVDYKFKVKSTRTRSCSSWSPLCERFTARCFEMILSRLPFPKAVYVSRPFDTTIVRDVEFQRKLIFLELHAPLRSNLDTSHVSVLSESVNRGVDGSALSGIDCLFCF